MWAFYTIPTLQFVARYSNNIIEHILLNKVTRFSEWIMCLVSFQYFQQHVQVLYNDFTDKETICIDLWSILVVHSHFKTNWRIHPQHYNGLINRGHWCWCEMKHVFVSISVYLSVILKWENSGAVLY